MTYIRTKEIRKGSGNFYDYEVETIHKKGQVIQKYVRFCSMMLTDIVGGVNCE